MKEMKFDLVIDAGGSVLGRAASHAAKQALLGKKVAVVNCENAVISGRRRFIIEDYKIMRQRGGSSLKGPHFPASSERLMKRTIRGMLSYKMGRGHDALKRIICYSKIPAELQGKGKKVELKELKTTSIKLGELSREL